MLDFAMRLVSRDAGDAQQSNNTINPTMVILLVVLLALLVVTLILIGGLLLLRQRRRARQQAALPQYNEDIEKRLSMSSTSSHHRRGRARQLDPVFTQSEKQVFVDHSCSPPDSPLPEIRITFPEEIDETGKRKSGRVVVVHVGDTAIGLEPAEGLPAYQRIEDGRFDSIDLDRVGGLVEKARNAPK